MRKVPIVDPKTHKIVLASAPKQVHCPLRLEVKMGDVSRTTAMEVVASRRGIERLLGAAARDALALETLV